ncbi:hypothetical protein ACHWQZ_G015613, partial [Mnemiopsis leidyi]
MYRVLVLILVLSHLIFSLGFKEAQVTIVSAEAAGEFIRKHDNVVLRIENAFDNNINTVYAPPDYSQENWATFNLGSLFRIGRITVINRQDKVDYLEILNNTEVNVVDTTRGRKYLCGMLYVTDLTLKEESQTYNFSCDAVGNQVMLTDRDVSDRATLSFAEIKVYLFSGF